MKQKRLYVLLVLALMYCTTAFSQHPYSSGHNPFFWLIAGGIGAVVSYAIVWAIGLLIELLKRGKNRIADSSNEMKESNVLEQIESEHKNENNDISSSIYNEDIFIEGKLQDNDYSSKTDDISIFPSKIRRIFSGDISDSGVRKRKIFAIVIYAILLLISVGIIESYVHTKRDRLYSEILLDVKRPFDDIGEKFISVKYFVNNPDNMKFIETPIPSLKSVNTETKWQWTNMFSETEHLYRIVDAGWSLECFTYQEDVSSVRGIIVRGHYMPCLITAPKGVEFNTQIAKNILNQADLLISNNIYQIEAFDTINNALYSYSNDYFYIRSEYNYNDSMPDVYDIPSIENIPLNIETTGTDPIYDEDGHFTGYYLFGMQVIGPYKILFGYKTERTFYVTEDGPNQDRALYYGLVFTILTSILALYLLRITRKLKVNKLILTESLKNRMLRYADPINFINKPQPQKVAIARDVYEKLLDPKTDYSQVEDIADEFKEKTGINLITEQERAYLLGICSRIKKKNKQLKTKKLVNNLYVILADISNVSGKDYSMIQEIISRILNNYK